MTEAAESGEHMPAASEQQTPHFLRDVIFHGKFKVGFTVDLIRVHPELPKFSFVFHLCSLLFILTRAFFLLRCCWTCDCLFMEDQICCSLDKYFWIDFQKQILSSSPVWIFLSSLHSSLHSSTSFSGFPEQHVYASLKRLNVNLNFRWSVFLLQFQLFMADILQMTWGMLGFM